MEQNLAEVQNVTPQLDANPPNHPSLIKKLSKLLNELINRGLISRSIGMSPPAAVPFNITGCTPVCLRCTLALAGPVLSSIEGAFGQATTEPIPIDLAVRCSRQATRSNITVRQQHSI